MGRCTDPIGGAPILHDKEGRVEAHIFLCVLSCHLLMSIERTLLDAGVHIMGDGARDFEEDTPGQYHRAAH